MGIDTNKLTYKEAISIIKAITAYNSGTLEFLHDYLKYANELDISVAKDSEKIMIKVGMPSVH